MNGERAVSVAELAVLLRVSRSTVYIKANSGDIPGFRVGSAWRFYPSVVDAHLNRPVDPWAMSPASARARRAS